MKRISIAVVALALAVAPVAAEYDGEQFKADSFAPGQTCGNDIAVGQRGETGTIYMQVKGNPKTSDCKDVITHPVFEQDGAAETGDAAGAAK